MRSRPATTVLVLALLALPAGCSRAPEADPERPRRGGTLTVGIADRPDSPVPFLAREGASLVVANRALPRLARERMPDAGHAAELVPELAESWRLAPDGLSLSARLRAGTWSDGKPVTCEDVRFTVRAAADPYVAWPGAAQRRHVVAVECPGPLEVVFRFDASYPGQVVDALAQYVLPASMGRIPFYEWRAAPWWSLLPAGGAFRVVPGPAESDRLELLRHGGWYGPNDRPLLDRAVLRVIPDAATRMNALLAGEIDVADGLLPGNAARLAADDRVRVVRRPGWTYTYVGWMTVDRDAYARYRAGRERECRAAHRAPCPDDPGAVARLAAEYPHPLFGDPRVRRAMTLAIDRRGLVDTLFRGEADVPASPFLAPSAEHDPDLAPWPYDPAAARELLAAAGCADRDHDGVLESPSGRAFAFDLLVPEGSPVRREVALRVQRDLAVLGIEARLVAVAPAAFHGTLAAHGSDAWIGSWQASLRSDMTELLHAGASADANFGAFGDSAADAVADEARRTADPAGRARLWRRWEARFHELQPYTMLFRPNRIVGVSKRVMGADAMTAADPLDGLENWWLAPESR